jgi:hypothetical protein
VVCDASWLACALASSGPHPAPLLVASAFRFVAGGRPAVRGAQGKLLATSIVLQQWAAPSNSYRFNEKSMIREGANHRVFRIERSHRKKATGV